MPRLFRILRIIISLSLLFIIIYKTDFHSLLLILKKADLKLFILSLLIYILSQYLSTHRWRLLIVTKGIEVPFSRLLSFYFVGMFFNLFMPTLIGGDLFRTYDLYKETSDVKEAAASVLVERIAGVLALSSLSLLSLIFGFSYIIDKPIVIYSILGWNFIFISSIILIFNENIKNFFSSVFVKIKLWGLLVKFHDAIFEYKKYPRTLMKVILLSFVVQINFLIIFYIMAAALNLDINFIYIWVFTPLITLFSMIPVSLAGWGLREGATIYLYSKIGCSTEASLLLSLSVTFIMTITSLMGGIILTFRKR